MLHDQLLYPKAGICQSLQYSRSKLKTKSHHKTGYICDFNLLAGECTVSTTNHSEAGETRKKLVSHTCIYIYTVFNIPVLNIPEVPPSWIFLNTHENSFKSLWWHVPYCAMKHRLRASNTHCVTINKLSKAQLSAPYTFASFKLKD